MRSFQIFVRVSRIRDGQLEARLKACSRGDKNGGVALLFWGLSERPYYKVLAAPARAARLAQAAAHGHRVTRVAQTAGMGLAFLCAASTQRLDDCDGVLGFGAHRVV